MLLVTGQGVLDLFLCLQTTNLIIKQCAFSFVKLKETGLPYSLPLSYMERHKIGMSEQSVYF
jgi:hypothetical protein